MLVNVVQLGYTARYLRCKSAVMTAAIRISAEQTLLGLMDREDLTTLISDMIDSAVDEVYRQLRPFDGPVKLLFEKKGGKAAILKKVGDKFTKAKPRIEQAFHKPIADETSDEAEEDAVEAKEEAATDETGAESSHSPNRFHTFTEEMQVLVQPFFGWFGGAKPLVPSEIDMLASEQPPPKHKHARKGAKGGINDDDDDDDDGDALDQEVRQSVTEVAEAVTEAVEKSMAAKVQAAWRGKQGRRSLQRKNKSASQLQAVMRGNRTRRSTESSN